MSHTDPLFTTRFPVRWEDTDPAGIVFYANYFKFFEKAEEDLFAAHGLPRHDFVTRHGIWMPRVESRAAFVAPCRLGDTVELALRVGQVGTSSVRYEYELHRVEPGPPTLALTGYVAVVCVNRETFTPTPIPGPMRAMLGQGRNPQPGA